jgi:hypothetical protein
MITLYASEGQGMPTCEPLDALTKAYQRIAEGEPVEIYPSPKTRNLTRFRGYSFCLDTDETPIILKLTYLIRYYNKTHVKH